MFCNFKFSPEINLILFLSAFKTCAFQFVGLFGKQNIYSWLQRRFRFQKVKNYQENYSLLIYCWFFRFLTLHSKFSMYSKVTFILTLYKLQTLHVTFVCFLFFFYRRKEELQKYKEEQNKPAVPDSDVLKMLQNTKVSDNSGDKNSGSFSRLQDSLNNEGNIFCGSNWITIFSSLSMWVVVNIPKHALNPLNKTSNSKSTESTYMYWDMGSFPMYSIVLEICCDNKTLDIILACSTVSVKNSCAALQIFLGNTSF